jgi:hypothetical protein
MRPPVYPVSLFRGQFSLFEKFRNMFCFIREE